MRHTALALALSACLAVTSGCATIMGGGQSRLQVSVDGPETGVTTTVKGIHNEEEVTHKDRHFDVVLDRQSSYVVVASAAGYAHEIKVVKMDVNPWVWGNYGFMAAGFALMYLAPAFQSRRETSSGAIINANPDPAFLPAGAMAATVGLLVDLLLKNGTKHDTNVVELHLEKQE